MKMYIPASYFDNWKPENQTVSNTKAHPHAEVIKAWADGIPCQFRTSNDSPWVDLKSPSMNPVLAWYLNYQYRIKPKTIKYRVALVWDGEKHWTCTADNTQQEKDFEIRSEFVKWLTDWIEVEAS